MLIAAPPSAIPKARIVSPARQQCLHGTAPGLPGRVGSSSVGGRLSDAKSRRVTSGDACSGVTLRGSHDQSSIQA